MAILATGKNQKTLVDLGPAENLDIDLEPNDQLTIEGAPLRVNDRPVVMAHELTYDGETITIDRSQPKS